MAQRTLSFLLLLAVLPAAPMASQIVIEAVGPNGEVSSVLPRTPVCIEPELLAFPVCGNTDAFCSDSAASGCAREGFQFRFLFCHEPFGSHHTHPFDWTLQAGAFPLLLELRTPNPDPVNDGDGNSAAYVGGDATTTLGDFFGLLSGDYCDEFTLQANDIPSCGDDLPGTNGHVGCLSDFFVEWRTLGLPDPTVPLPFISTPGGQLPDAQAGVFYEVRFDAVGGTQDYLWSIGTNQLPPGLDLVFQPQFPFSIFISGTPTDAGGYDFGVKVMEDPTNPVFLNGPNCAGAPQCPPEMDEVMARIFVDPLFTDGFESGDTSSWTATVP